MDKRYNYNSSTIYCSYTSVGSKLSTETKKELNKLNKEIKRQNKWQYTVYHMT